MASLSDELDESESLPLELLLLLLLLLELLSLSLVSESDDDPEESESELELLSLELSELSEDDEPVFCSFAAAASSLGMAGLFECIIISLTIKFVLY